MPEIAGGFIAPEATAYLSRVLFSGSTQTTRRNTLRAKLFILAGIEEKNPGNHQGRPGESNHNMRNRGFERDEKSGLPGSVAYLLCCQYSFGHSLDGGNRLVCGKSPGHVRSSAAPTNGSTKI